MSPDSPGLPADGPTSRKSSNFAEGRSADGADGAEDGGETQRGMVLPFEPLTMSFDNMHYFVDVPAVGGSGLTWGCNGVLCKGGASCRTNGFLHILQAQLQPASSVLTQSSITPCLCQWSLYRQLCPASHFVVMKSLASDGESRRSQQPQAGMLGAHQACEPNRLTICLQALAGKSLPTIKKVDGKDQLELLQGITSAFRPGILTCLMVSQAGLQHFSPSQ